MRSAGYFKRKLRHSCIDIMISSCDLWLSISWWYSIVALPADSDQILYIKCELELPEAGVRSSQAV